METLMERAIKIQAEGIYLGGLLNNFEIGGRKLLITLLSEGIIPSSKVLDIGCGCLRGGYWLIHFLDEGCYFGIEPNVEMVNGGVKILLEPGLADLKKPKFDHNDVFDFKVFGEKFDFFVARSIWTHASKLQIQKMLDGFLKTSKPESVFITSYLKPTLFKPDYKGTKWIGRSHETIGQSFPAKKPGFVHHSWSWIQTECAHRGLTVKEIKGKAYNYFNQIWLCIKYQAL
jgi:hypothetical protein